MSHSDEPHVIDAEFEECFYTHEEMQKNMQGARNILLQNMTPSKFVCGEHHVENYFPHWALRIILCGVILLMMVTDFVAEHPVWSIVEFISILVYYLVDFIESKV